MQRLPAQQRDDFFYIPATIRAPLATFDTIDLGDEDGLSIKSLSQQSLCNKAAYEDEASISQTITFSAKIGGAHSKGKDPASKTGSGPDSQKDTGHGEHLKGETPHSEGRGRGEAESDEDAPTPTNQSPSRSPVPGGNAAEAVRLDDTATSSSSASTSKQGQGKGPSALGVQRIGKVAAPWLPHQDSDSSSSSGSGSDVFTFRPIHGSTFTAAVHDEDDDDDDDDNDEVDHTPSTRRRLVRERSKDYTLNLYPEDLDPSQISSPSKRKAFQKRLQRLQVKTSPITRPRSTTPISVHPLEEYAASSPDKSPASPFQDKLKITLPGEEFSSRPKSPRHQRRPEVQDDAHFVFSEERLFSHSRSALVIDEVGQVPISPNSRRVLIPPTLSPSSSPKVARAAGRFTGENAPQLVYFENEKEGKIFGEPAGEQVSENWASFPEAAESSDTSEHIGKSDQTDALDAKSDQGIESVTKSEQCAVFASQSGQGTDTAAVYEKAIDSDSGLDQKTDLSTKPDQGIDSAARSKQPSDISVRPVPSSAVRCEQLIDYAKYVTRPGRTPVNLLDETDEILTVNIQSAGTSKPANIQVVLSAASSSTPSLSSPESCDEGNKDRAQQSEPQDKKSTELPQDTTQEAEDIQNTTQKSSEKEHTTQRVMEPQCTTQELTELPYTNQTSEETEDMTKTTEDSHDMTQKTERESQDTTQEVFEPFDYNQKPLEHEPTYWSADPFDTTWNKMKTHEMNYTPAEMPQTTHSPRMISKDTTCKWTTNPFVTTQETTSAVKTFYQSEETANNTYNWDTEFKDTAYSTNPTNPFYAAPVTTDTHEPAEKTTETLSGMPKMAETFGHDGRGDEGYDLFEPTVQLPPDDHTPDEPALTAFDTTVRADCQ